jgi:lipopolysaccharide/colanic/teichoic acid biosynthesis glycosyltransferase
VADWIQRSLALAALVLLSPVIAAVAVAVRLGSHGPVLFGAHRVGRDGQLFTAWKYRTMAWRPGDVGPAVSVASDPRVTRVGARLRRYRLDELPQLWNVVRGEMRLVGPRPEDPRFVDRTDARQRAVLAVAPGITGLAQLAFADEARLLGGANPEAIYRSIILPRKLAVDEAYVHHRSAALDIRIILGTVLVIVGRQAPTGAIDRLVGSAEWRLP